MPISISSVLFDVLNHGLLMYPLQEGFFIPIQRATFCNPLDLGDVKVSDNKDAICASQNACKYRSQLDFFSFFEG